MLSISHCIYSNTIRQFPQNYLLARFEAGHWIMEPDLAADKGLVVALTLSLMEHSHKWNKSPAMAIMGIGKYLNVSANLLECSPEEVERR